VEKVAYDKIVNAVKRVRFLNAGETVLPIFNYIHTCIKIFATRRNRNLVSLLR
jgi:hypothetical protein